MMQCHPAGPAWFVLYLAPRAEAAVCDEVRANGFETYMPMERSIRVRRRRRVQVEQPLFSRYLFVRFDPYRDDWQSLLHLDGVEDVLSNCDVPSRVPDAWIEALHRAEHAGAFDRRPDASPFKIGDRVRIAEGPFTGLHARIEQLVAKLKSSTATKRIRVLMDFLGQKTMIELPVGSVEKA
jgi:transcriptional antiterminator RfaH